MGEKMAVAEETFEQALRRLAPLKRRDPVSYVKELAVLQDIKGAGMRHRRAAELGTAIHTLQQIREVVGFEADLMFRGDRAYVDVDGVWLDCTHDSYYLKSAGKPGSIGRFIAARMAQFGVEPRCVLDLGAFQGEAALWMAKNFPTCVIHAVEPCSATFASLQAALGVQPFDTSNVRLHNLAIGDRDGEARFSCSRATENSLFIREGRDSTETVRVRTLETFFDEHGIGDVDFIKFDIEHAEPLTMPFFEKRADRVRMMLVEYALKGDLEKYGYFRLTDLLEASGFRILSPIDNRFITSSELKAYLLNRQASGRNGADICYVRTN